MALALRKEEIALEEEYAIILLVYVLVSMDTMVIAASIRPSSDKLT
jgi:hypothetical protein